MDEFTINTKYSTYYIFSHVITYVSILVSIYGAIKYKSKIYNIFCVKKYRYSKKEETIVGENTKK